jgi:hypothetical protein
MMVTRILGNCPGCGGHSTYGNVDINESYVLRGCRSCKYRVEIPLPEVRKAILYLDQCFFSGAFRDRDLRFATAAKRIEEITSLQLLAVPFSSVHEDESHQWEHHADLMKFIKATSHGHRFNPAYQVVETQVITAFNAWLKQKPSIYNLEENEALESDVHRWEGYFWVDAGHYLGDVELIREIKKTSVNRLLDLFEAWRESTSTFEEDVALELLNVGQNYLETYLTRLRRLARGDFNALLDSPIVSQTIQHMINAMPRDLEPLQALRRCGEFFASDHFSSIPAFYIETRAYAQLKAMVKDGAYVNREKAEPRLNGLFYDLKHISTYAPYCQAFFMDQPMAALMNHPKIGLEQNFGVRVFSLNNLDEMMAWLDERVFPAGMPDLSGAC